MRKWDMHPFNLYGHEPCHFSTCLFVAMITHVSLHDVLHELRKVTSGSYSEGILAPLAFFAV